MSSTAQVWCTEMSVSKNEPLTPKTWLQNIKNHYENLESFSIQINYELFKGHQSDIVNSQYSASIFRNGKKSLQKIADNEIFSDENNVVSINHREKAIVVTNPIAGGSVIPDVESTLNFCRDVQVKKSGDLVSLFLFIQPNTDLPFTKVDIVSDKNYNLHSITLYYAHQTNFSSSYFSPEYDYAKLKISYTEMKTNWHDKEGILFSGKYITEENGKIIPASEFSKYKLVDYRNPVNP